MQSSRLLLPLSRAGLMSQTAAISTSVPSCTTEMHRFRSPVLPSNRGQLARYGGRQTVTVLPGDGIGPEMIKYVREIFDFAHAPIDFEEVPLSSNLQGGEADLDNAIMAIERNGIALKGNIETKFDDPQFKSRNLELRRRLDLYANVLHCVTVPTIPTRHHGIDIVMIRENTEGEYSGLEHETVPGVVESLKIITKEKIERIARFAFQYAIRHNRKKVTAVHKANIQKLGDGLFLKVASEMAKNEYPEIQFESMIVDNASMQLVSRPQQFDIMLMPNLYGNIISNIACGLVGGPGLVSGINVGAQYAVFETGTRNTGTSLAGKDVANPTAFIRAGVDMLRYLNYNAHANLISDALFKALTESRIHTPDVGGDARSSELIEAVIKNIDEELKNSPLL
uniref:Isocitrate dehydrogenase [NAD] subunit, mitochondrial n=1 Tax=Steinernema glaseri TaxID=37863 RepID=A0A1I7YBA3_9BILA